MDLNFYDILKHFNLNLTPSIYGNGHINDTYIVHSQPDYILQRINKNVFTNPPAVMENIQGVTEFLRAKIIENGGDPERETLNLIYTIDGKPYYEDENGEFYRVYKFIDNAVSYDLVEDPSQLYSAARAFGKFQNMLADYPAEKLHETIVDFHNTKARFKQFTDAVAKDAAGRAKDVQEEIQFVLDREADCSVVVDVIADGRIPLRVTHNDTKLNNVMLDYDTREALCVIDLDTIMPGSALYDFGDSIRFGAATAAEDEQDLSKVSMSLELYRTFTEGFLSACGDSLTEEEIKLLPIGAKMMTLECGLRFLTDYLKGDTYFKTHREGQNLDRARTQMTLVADMEAKMPQMEKMIQEVLA